MITDKLVSPEYRSSAFHCPHCGVYANQQWIEWNLGGRLYEQKHHIERTICGRCSQFTIWFDEKLIYPAGLVGPMPVEDMNASVREVYEEARAIASASPRAAAALLRVCVEMVVNELEFGSGTLSAKIGQLVKKGLDPRIQKMLDSVRVFANEGGSHPGEINLKEQPETVQMLMFCVNRIVEQMVTWPGQVSAFYDTIPENKRKGIEDRDRKAQKSSSSWEERYEGASEEKPHGNG